MMSWFDEHAEMIRDLADEGFNAEDISVILTGRRMLTRRVEKVLSGAVKIRTFDATDTYIDEVAIERASRGDREVWRNLTPTERGEFVRRTEARFQAEAESEWRAHTGRAARTALKSNLLDLLGVTSDHWRMLVLESDG